MFTLWTISSTVRVGAILGPKLILFLRSSSSKQSTTDALIFSTPSMITKTPILSELTFSLSTILEMFSATPASVYLSILTSQLQMQTQMESSIPSEHLNKLKKLSWNLLLSSHHLSDSSNLPTFIRSYLLFVILSLTAILSPEGKDVGKSLCPVPDYVRDVLSAISKGLRKALCKMSQSLILETAYRIKDCSWFIKTILKSLDKNLLFAAKLTTLAIIFIMSISSKKVKNETFTEYCSFRALYNGGTRIIRSYLRPLHANAANPKPNPPAGEQRPEEEHYCKFSNDHVLRAFLSYLGGGQLAGLERVDDGEASVDLVVQRFEVFKKYYHSKAKEVEGLDGAEVDRAILQLKSKYLLLQNVSEAYREDTKLEENGSKVALLVLKSEGNIVLAALKRTLPEEEMKGKGEEEEKEVKEEDILLAVCSSLITLWLLALLAFIIYSIYQSFDSETGAFKLFGILQQLGLLPTHP